MAGESFADHLQVSPALPAIQSKQNRLHWGGSSKPCLEAKCISPHTVHCSEQGYTVLDDARPNLYPHKSELQSQICLKMRNF